MYGEHRRCRPAAMAAAAWSWVEKMLHEAQRTSAPSAFSVSISTAVWIVMCSEPVMRAPRSGWICGVLLADRHQAGHLGLGDLDLLAAPVGELEVGDLVVGEVLGFGAGIHVVPFRRQRVTCRGRFASGLVPRERVTDQRAPLRKSPEPGAVRHGVATLLGDAHILPELGRILSAMRGALTDGRHEKTPPAGLQGLRKRDRRERLRRRGHPDRLRGSGLLGREPHARAAARGESAGPGAGARAARRRA